MHCPHTHHSPSPWHPPRPPHPQVGAYADVEKVAASRNIRRGKGKLRNRRYVSRKGPLVVYGSDAGIARAFRNLPGVEVASVDALNLLQLAPGGHLGRFIIWTKSAFEKLDAVFGELGWGGVGGGGGRRVGGACL